MLRTFRVDYNKPHKSLLPRIVIPTFMLNALFKKGLIKQALEGVYNKHLGEEPKQQSEEEKDSQPKKW